MPTTSHHPSFNRDPEEFAEVNVTTVPTPVSANSGSRLNDRDEQHRGDRDKQRKRIA